MNQFDSNTIIPEAFKHMDANVNNFRKIKDIETSLMWGQRDDEHQPLVSVVIPTFNRTMYLREAIESVLEQKKYNFKYELIVIDNTPLNERNSTPALELIRNLHEDKILYYHNCINIGSGYNWNRGVEISEGKWICFLHDDDILFPWAFHSLEELIKRDGVYSKPLGYIQARRVLFSYRRDISIQSIARESRGFCIELTRTGTLITGRSETGIPSYGTTILRKAYIEFGGINYDFGPTADAILGYRMMKKYSVIWTDKVLGGYRWLVNESRRPSTIKKLIRSDYLFQKYRADENTFSRLFNAVAGDVINEINVCQKQCESGTTIENLLSKDVPYHRCGYLKKKLYDSIRITYKLANITKSFLTEIRYRAGLYDREE